MTAPLVRADVVATSNVSIATGLSAGNTVDGQTLVGGWIVLLTAQTDPSENGLYDVPLAGRAPRLAGYRTEYNSLVGISIYVMRGASNADTKWDVTSDPGGTLGITSLTIINSNDATATALAGKVDVAAKATITDRVLSSTGWLDTAHVGVPGGLEGPVLQYKADIATQTFPASVKRVRTQFYDELSTTFTYLGWQGGGTYVRLGKTLIDTAGVAGFPAQAWARSLDRFMPDGSIDATNGGYWVLSPLHPNVYQLGADTLQTNDSAAAFNALFQYVAAYGYSVLTAAGTTAGNNDPVEWPSNIFRIASTIESVANRVNIRGDGALFRPHASFASTYAMDLEAWRGKISDFKFVGFTKALHIHNANIDQGHLILEGLEFHLEDVAVTLETQSSYTRLQNFMWDQSKVALHIVKGDSVVVDGGWITQGVFDNNEDATFENESGVLHLTGGIVCVDRAQTATKTAWVNNYSSVECSRIPFGGHSGGRTIVNNYAEADTSNPVVPVGIIIRDCAIFSQVEAVRLFKLPNYVLMKGNSGMPGLTGATIMFDETYATLSDELARAKGQCSITFDNIPINISHVLRKRSSGGTVTPAYDMLPLLYFSDNSSLGSALVTNTTGAEIKFHKWLNSNEFTPLRSDGIWLIEATAAIDDETAGLYSRYRVQVDTDGSDMAVTAEVAGASASAPVVYIDTGDFDLLKIRLNSDTVEKRVHYRIRKIGDFCDGFGFG